MISGRLARPRRVLMLHASDDGYGADRVLLRVVSAVERFADVCVVLPDDVPGTGWVSAQLRERGTPFLYAPLAVMRRKHASVRGLLAFSSRLVRSTVLLARHIRRERVDVVYTHTAVVLSGAFSALLARRPHVWHVLEMVVSPRVMRPVVAHLVGHLARHIVAASQAVADHLAVSCDRVQSKTTVLRTGVDLRRFRPGIDGREVRAEAGAGAHNVLVGMLGRVGAWKGQELLVDAAALLAARFPQARYVLVGGVFDNQLHHLARLRARVAMRRLADRVLVWDYRDDVPAFLAALDIFVLPSVWPDPLPNTLLEAMASGLAIVASAHGGAVEAVEDGRTGLLFTPGDASDLAAKLARLIADPGLRAVLGKAARARAEALFDERAFEAAFGAYFADVMRVPATDRGWPPAPASSGA